MATVSVSSGTGKVYLQPTSTMTATNENYVNAITATSGELHKRDVSEKLIKRYGDQGITGLLELMVLRLLLLKLLLSTTKKHFDTMI